MKMKIDSMMLLLFLTFIVGAYNYQFLNVPSSMYLNAYKLSLSPEELGRVQFRLTLPSQGVPHEYRDVTDDLEFRVNVRDYILASDTVRDIVRIPERSTTEWWLRNISNSLQGYDMTLQFFNDTYFLQARYYPDLLRTPSEYSILWAINITTIIAWVLFVARLVHKTRRVQ